MLGSLLLALALFASPLLADSTGEWRSYGATAASTKYAPFDQIDATNFAQLEIAWTWSSADRPILDAATGERVWHFQIAHHGMWDYDLRRHPTSSISREVKAVA